MVRTSSGSPKLLSCSFWHQKGGFKGRKRVFMGRNYLIINKKTSPTLTSGKNVSGEETDTLGQP